VEEIQAMLEQRALQGQRVTQVLAVPRPQEIQGQREIRGPQATQGLVVLQVREPLMGVLVNQGSLEMSG
jgi:hypothetical protein